MIPLDTKTQNELKLSNGRQALADTQKPNYVKSAKIDGDRVIIIVRSRGRDIIKTYLFQVQDENGELL